MYGPIKIEEIHYEDGTIRQVFDNRDVYMIYPDDLIPTGRVEKQKPLSKDEFEKLVKSIKNDLLNFHEEWKSKH